MGYRTRKIFDYRYMTPEIKAAFLALGACDGNGAEITGYEDDVYIDYEVGIDTTDDSSSIFDNWLIAEGAEMGEDVLIAIW